MISNKDSTSINTLNANVVKRCFIEAMLRDGVIPEKTYTEMEKYAVVCMTPDVLGEHIESLHESKEAQFFVVKLVDLPEKTEIENNAFLTSQEELIKKIEALEEENLRLKGEIIRISHIEPEVQTFYSGGTAENPTPEVSTTSKFAKNSYEETTGDY